MIRDLVLLGAANVALLAAGHGILRLAGFRPAAADLPWSVGVAYIAGVAATGVLAASALVLGLALLWWQFLLGWGCLFVAGVLRPAERPNEWRPVAGWVRLLPAAAILVVTLLAVNLAVQPVWTEDAWSIWAAKAHSIALRDGLDPALLSSASVRNADYPLLVPVLELVALRFCGIATELVPLQLGLVFTAFPFALAGLIRDRVPSLLAWVVPVAAVMAPTLQVQNASAVADVPLAVFFALAGVCAWRWVELGETRMLALAGILAAGALGSKAEGAVFVAALLVAIVAVAPRRAKPLTRVVAMSTAVVVSAIPWTLWARIHDLDNAYSAAGGAGSVDLLAAADRLPRASAAMLREIADPSSWLALVGLAVLGVVIGMRRAATRAGAVYTSLVTLASLGSLLVVYWATPLAFDYHVATSARRVITAPVLFAAAMAPLLLWRSTVHDSER